MVALREQVESRLDMIGPVEIRGLMSLITEAPPHQRRQLYLEGETRAKVIQRLGAEAEDVLAAMLSGTPYYPGVESQAYQAMPAAGQARVSRETDKRFRAETGITRKLVFEGGDKPLARRWLELRDGVMRDRELDAEKQREMDANYFRYLHEAVDLLKEYSFDSATEPGGSKRYDLDYWRRVDDPVFNGKHMLVTHEGIEPAKAMKELFDKDKLKKWAFDCAEFFQVAILYARWKTMGDDAFNAGTYNGLKLRLHDSSGVIWDVLLQRDRPEEQMMKQKRGAALVPADMTVEQLLLDAPVGSRVTWRNLKAPETSDFFNENTLKLGKDQYAAHGLSKPGDRNVYSREEIERKLAKITDPDPSADYIKKNVFVRSIDYFMRPGARKRVK